MKAIDGISRRFRTLKLSTKVTLLYAALFSVMLVSISVFIMINTSVYYRISSEQETQELTDKIVKHIESGGSTDSDTISDIAGNTMLKVTVEEIKPKIPPEKPSVESQTLYDEPKKVKQPEMETIGGQRFMYHSKIARYRDKTYFVEVLRPYYREQKTLRNIFAVFIFMNIIGICFSFFIGRFISRQMLSPISQITKTANLISINDLSQRLEIPEPDDEIRKLSITFNDMIDGIQKSVQKQNRFVSDASHELRTPISVIKGYVNLIDRWGKTDKEVLQEAIDSIKYETDHMSRLIEKLLFLARGDDTPVNMSVVSMNGILDEIEKETKVMQKPSDTEINFTQEKNINIYGDSDLLKKLIWIFIENAIKYRREEKCVIEVSLYTEGGKVCVKIKDNGIGIKAEDLPHIFDRFYRSDESRGQTKGTGLGLSIAKKITAKHKGNIYVQSEPEKGSVFIIELDTDN